MADIAAGDVVYTMLPYPEGSRIEGRTPRFKNLVSLAFGDGALTYPTGGIPLSGVGLGFPSNAVEVVLVVDATDAPDTVLWQYDVTANTLRGYTDATTELSGAVAASEIIVLATGY